MRFFLAILAIIGLFILIFWLVFHNGSTSSTLPKALNLSSYATTDATVTFEIDGPINYDSAHRSIVITIGQNQNMVQVLEGYQGGVLDSATYPDNEPAYSEFLSALNYADFTTSHKSTVSSPTGTCALGNRYYFQVNEDGNSLQNLWTTSCGGEGTFNGDLATIETLFQAQIPNYSTTTAGVGLN
jgi:hypothetical protein